MKSSAKHHKCHCAERGHTCHNQYFLLCCFCSPSHSFSCSSLELRFLCLQDRTAGSGKTGSCSVGYSETSTLHLRGPTQPRPPAVSSEPVLSAWMPNTSTETLQSLPQTTTASSADRRNSHVCRGCDCRDGLLATGSQKLCAPAFIHSI